MRVEGNIRQCLKKFGDLAPGDVFTDSQRQYVYMKGNFTGDRQYCVALETGNIIAYGTYEMVIPLNGAFVISESKEE